MHNHKTNVSTGQQIV